jgi:hypothetical protein
MTAKDRASSINIHLISMHMHMSLSQTTLFHVPNSSWGWSGSSISSISVSSSASGNASSADLSPFGSVRVSDDVNASNDEDVGDVDDDDDDDDNDADDLEASSGEESDADGFVCWWWSIRASDWLVSAFAFICFDVSSSLPSVAGRGLLDSSELAALLELDDTAAFDIIDDDADVTCSRSCFDKLSMKFKRLVAGEGGRGLGDNMLVGVDDDDEIFASFSLIFFFFELSFANCVLFASSSRLRLFAALRCFLESDGAFFEDDELMASIQDNNIRRVPTSMNCQLNIHTYTRNASIHRVCCTESWGWLKYEEYTDDGWHGGINQTLHSLRFLRRLWSVGHVQAATQQNKAMQFNAMCINNYAELPKER